MLKREWVTVGYRRRVLNTVVYCDDCGKAMNWCIPRKEGDFCEKCWQKRQQKVMLSAKSRSK